MKVVNIRLLVNWDVLLVIGALGSAVYFWQTYQDSDSLAGTWGQPVAKFQSGEAMRRGAAGLQFVRVAPGEELYGGDWIWVDSSQAASVEFSVPRKAGLTLEPGTVVRISECPAAEPEKVPIQVMGGKTKSGAEDRGVGSAPRAMEAPVAVASAGPVQPAPNTEILAKSNEVPSIAFGWNARTGDTLVVEVDGRKDRLPVSTPGSWSGPVPLLVRLAKQSPAQKEFSVRWSVVLASSEELLEGPFLFSLRLRADESAVKKTLEHALDGAASGSSPQVLELTE